MKKVLTQIRRIKRKVDVWLFLYEDNGEQLPKAITVGYYAYYAAALSAVGGLAAVAL